MRRGLTLLLALAALAPALALAQDLDMDARIRASAAAAQSLQGPLDGGWTLAGADGKPIYAFQIVDKAGASEPLEGVWRDLRQPESLGDIGVIDSLQRSAVTLTIGFIAKPGDPAVTISLKSQPDGGWSGELREGTQVTPVTLRRS